MTVMSVDNVPDRSTTELPEAGVGSRATPTAPVVGLNVPANAGSKPQLDCVQAEPVMPAVPVTSNNTPSGVLDGVLFDVTGTAGITGSACTQTNCGFEPAFAGTFNPTTGAVGVALEPTPASGNSVVDLSGTLSTDMTVISGTYASTD